LVALALSGLLGASGCAQSVPAASALPEPTHSSGYPWELALDKNGPSSLTNADARLAKSEPYEGDLDGEPGEESRDEVPSPEPQAKKRRHPTGTPEPANAPKSEGERCLATLTAQKVRFKKLDERPGIETPILVTSPIGKVTYFAHGIDLLLDCRMALTLAQVSPLLQKHGVTRVRFSGAYVYRLTRHGKLSLHANGLALDVHALTVGKEVHEVEKEFARGKGCEGDLPLVNRIACELRDTQLFREVITPDYDADHKDHLHVAIPRLASTPTQLAAENPPAPAARAEAARRSAATRKTPESASATTAPAQPGSLPEALPEVSAPAPRNAEQSGAP
jgi:hypothetical protein